MIGAWIIVSVFVAFSIFGGCATIVGFFRFLKELFGG